jgi:hypothetical protein
VKIRKHQPATVGLSDAAREREVQREIENFLRALSSYADRFARDPQLSFEKHLYSVATGSRWTAAGEDRRRG